MRLFAFILGREYKLSLAELVNLLGHENLKIHNEHIAIFSLAEIHSAFINTIGGTTRILEVISETTHTDFATDVIADISRHHKMGKIVFALGVIGTKMSLADMAMRIKQTLKKRNFAPRALNTKNENIHSALFKKEKLQKSQTEYFFLEISDKKYLAKTLACQDIDAYTRRDTGKNRDMIVGMMPPKLVQIMINLLSPNTRDNGIYDPFCGLGTTLIEAANMGVYSLFASDISPDMVASSSAAISDFVKEETLWQERIKKLWWTPKKDFSLLSFSCFQNDARSIEKAFQNHKIPPNINIISEGFLGKVMRKHEITQDTVFAERRGLYRLYEDFFASLSRVNFSGEIVMSFPFWRVHDIYIFLEKIPEILDTNNFQIISLLPREMNLNTKNGTLLYRRNDQNVGREIIKISKK